MTTVSFASSVNTARNTHRPSRPTTRPKKRTEKVAKNHVVHDLAQYINNPTHRGTTPWKQYFNLASGTKLSKVYTTRADLHLVHCSHVPLRESLWYTFTQGQAWQTLQLMEEMPHEQEEVENVTGPGKPAV
ncbi:hypothetical protein K443DRAFT_676895 [Laccaria amethystina LaAM-08-1]|uniref:Uncharacterized protein n=1 Tax=Laccaria amethystina LaAM-08-1 TaxID=1095629 RepID=A0A0C9XE98_9AGAR|nr:hypothetical protein K443DRAFT_676895 [Laccaria amethystina LaAM-08-1]